MKYTYPKKRIKFVGKFTDLIPYGFKFQKFFANNYRCYHYILPNKVSPDIWIWQHLGGYVEFKYLYDLSYLVLEAILNPDIKRTTHVDMFENKEFELLELVLDKKNRTIIPRDLNKHDVVYLFKDLCKENNIPNEPEFKEQINDLFSQALEQCKKFQEIFIASDLEDKILELYNKGWFVIEDYPEKYKKY